MALKQLPGITHFLASSLLLLFTVSAAACGWGDDAETLRLAFFRCQVGNMAKFSPFLYSQHYFNEYEIHSKADSWRNCKEWQQKLGKTVNLNDIYTLQYNTQPEKFQLAYHTYTLATVFNGNTFVKQLLLPNNKALLDYFAFAKEMEYKGNPQVSKWESWDDEGTQNYWDKQDGQPQEIALGHIEKKLVNTTDKFLQQRYAFMLIRYGNTKNVIALYNRYFSNNSTTILQPWALLFKAYCTTNKAEQNYYLSLVFNQCEEKAIAVMQWYNHEDEYVKQTLKFAKNDHERAVILAIKAMRNPAPCLNEIKEVNRLWSGSDYVNMLIGREINKLEDWVFSPQMDNAGPDPYQYYYYNWEQNYAKNRKENYIKDMKYLRELKSYLIKLFPDTIGASHDYFASGIAHLSFMDDQISDGNKYALAISNGAPASVLVQKYTELALVAIRQGNLDDDALKQQLFTVFEKILNLAQSDNSYSKSVYSLLKVLSAEYNRHGDMATAGLLFLKAENCKGGYSDYGGFYSPDNFGNAPDYIHIGYFDRYATLQDMDSLVSIIDKKNKTPFEKFICDGTTTTRYFYIDLKGTIALRQNNLQLAYTTFKQVPDSFYKKSWYYSDLDEDPFYPKILRYALKNNTTSYNFNKAKFIQQIINLEAKHDADSYLKLANAYYNISYMGNAWMMVTYSQGSVYHDIIFGATQNAKLSFCNGNYANLTTAIKYYKKALLAAKNDEQRAMASLMLYACSNKEDYGNQYYYDDKLKKHEPGKWLIDFYSKYKNTATFKRYSCPDMEYHLK